jgi:anti-sigma B factor antagonist
MSGSKRAVRSRNQERPRINTTKNQVARRGAPIAPLPLFVIKAAKEDDTYVIRVEGELDLFERPRLERALRKAEASHVSWILLDLEGLTFIDAAGLSALVSAWRRSSEDGNRLQATRGVGCVADIFHLTALDRMLPFVPE